MAVVNRLANLGSHLGLRCGAMERLASLDTRDYSYPTPTPQQQQLLLQQAALLAGPQLAYQPRPAALPVAPAANASIPSAFTHLPLSASALPAPGPAVRVQSACDDFLDSMLPLDLDDDCLKLMFGEEGDESNAGTSSSLQGSDRRITRSTAAAKACHEQVEDDDAVDLLFQDLSSLRHATSYGDLDLDVLHSLQQDLDTASSGGESEAGQKRAKKEGPHLMLSMNYASAAETINSIIIERDHRVPMVSTVSDSLGEQPGSPESAASAGTLELERSNSCGKRKRN